MKAYNLDVAKFYMQIYQCYLHINNRFIKLYILLITTLKIHNSARKTML